MDSIIKSFKLKDTLSPEIWDNVKSGSAKLKPENITNIKILHLYNEDLMLQYKIICNKIINNLVNIKDLQDQIFVRFQKD
jgi:hypothetical protein